MESIHPFAAKTDNCAELVEGEIPSICAHTEGNRMKRILAGVKRNLFHGGITEEEYRQISPVIFRENRRNLMTYTIIAALFLGIMFVMSFVDEGLEKNRWVYVGTTLLLLAVYGVAREIEEKDGLLLLGAIYAFMSIMFIFGIILGTVTRPDEQTVTFVALLLTVPLLFTDRPIRMAICILFYSVVFIITAIYVKVDYVLMADIVDVTIFGMCGVIVSTYMMSVKNKRVLYERQVSILSETDLLTGLRNRNCYERKLKEYASGKEKRLSVIYVDVNGLHEMNNSKGHEAGDRMLQFIGSVSQETFGKENAYRIGGDEFVMLLADEGEEQLQRKIERMKRLVEENAYHVSIGVSSGDCAKTDVSLLIKSAEARMYEEKELFYRQKGMDRRIRA